MSGTRKAWRAFFLTIAVGAFLPVVMADPALAARAKTLTISDASVIEGDAGSSTMNFTITWTGSKGGGTVSVHYATADVSATAGNDYTAKSGNVSLSSGGCHCATVGVSIIGDNVVEPTETFQLNLSSPVNASIGDGVGDGTIYDNEGPAGFVAGDSTAGEAAGSMTLQVFLTKPIASTVTVDYATSDGTALAGTDYTAKTGTLTFTPGQTAKTVSLLLTNDALDEDDETLALDLSNPNGAVLTAAHGRGTIQDDDAEPNISIGDASVSEGDAGTASASFAVTLSAPSGREIDVDYATTDDTATVADNDYSSTTGTLMFPPGQTSLNVDVPVVGDHVFEGDESYSIALTGEVKGTLLDATAAGTIINDDAMPEASIGDVTLPEGDAGTTNATFAVSLSNASAFPVGLDWITVDATATAGSDYEASGGNIAFSPGEMTKSVDVVVDGDLVQEFDETVEVHLSNAVQATISDDFGVATITNDDFVPTTLTLKVVKTKAKLSGKGLLEPAVPGMKITVTLLHKRGRRYKKLTEKAVTMNNVLDRDGDGDPEGAYVAAFKRPRRGSYMLRASFAGGSGYEASSKDVKFKL